MDSRIGNQSSAPTASEGVNSLAETRVSSVLSYEQQLRADPRWALSEGSRHFEEKSKVFDALRSIARRLDELKIEYAVVGGMALFRYGLRRFTEDVDILVTKENLKRIHADLQGRGYLPVHQQSKHLRDTEAGVRIEFLTTGDYPGDGKPKPVAFPDPKSVSTESNAIKYIDLPALVEMKLASGMTNPGRLKDLSDVLELIKLLDLRSDFADHLNPYVREKFSELLRQSERRYIRLWRNKWLTADAKTIDDMIVALRKAAETLESMRRDGAILETEGVEDDYARLVTTDPEVAKKYDMVEESEFWGGGEPDEDSADDGIVAEGDDG